MVLCGGFAPPHRRTTCARVLENIYSICCTISQFVWMHTRESNIHTTATSTHARSSIQSPLLISGGMVFRVCLVHGAKCIGFPIRILYLYYVQRLMMMFMMTAAFNQLDLRTHPWVIPVLACVAHCASLFIVCKSHAYNKYSMWFCPCVWLYCVVQ